jgi:hypothetical protein
MFIAVAVVTSPYHSFIPKKAKKQRTLVKSPDNINHRERGKPLERMTVRRLGKATRSKWLGHEAVRQTDANGNGTFPAQKSDYSNY